MTCPACGSGLLSPLLHIDEVPVACNVLFDDTASAIAVQRGTLALAACPECGALANTAFDDRLVDYGAYENSLYGSATFRAYLDELVNDLVGRFDLRGKTLLEIGAGDGHFLQHLCAAGRNTGVGVDPTYAVETIAGDVRLTPGGVAEARLAAADFVCARHVLEHLPDPAELLTALRRGPANAGAAAYFEVPNSGAALDSGGVWDLIYEHVLYFGEAALRALLSRCGFAVAQVRSAYGGQFLGAFAAASTPSRAHVHVGVDWAGFPSHYKDTLERWQQRLDHLAANGRRVALWGAGSKGTTFLNVGDSQGVVAAVVDVNPRKQGRHVPGSGQQVLAPAELPAFAPDVVIVSNRIYVDEVAVALSQLDITADLLPL